MRVLLIWSVMALALWTTSLTAAEGPQAPADQRHSDVQVHAGAAHAYQRIQLAQALPQRCRRILNRMQSNYHALRYIASYPDLMRRIGRNPNGARQHFVRHGCYENRGFKFDGFVYVAGYADLIRRIGLNENQALDHFFRHGFREGRMINKFRYQAYVRAYPDLRVRIGAKRRQLARHCIEFGLRERRKHCG